MTKQAKIEVPPERLDRLFDALREDDLKDLAGGDDSEASDVATEDELSDDDAGGYAFGALSGDDVARVEGHLRASPTAEAEMQWLRNEATAWQGNAGRARLEKLARKIRLANLTPHGALDRLRAALKDHLDALSVAAKVPLKLLMDDEPSNRVVASGETPDGLIRWVVSRAGQDLVTVDIRSSAIALDGVRVRLRVDDWCSDAQALAKTTPTADEVMAQVTMGAAERVRIRPGSAVRLELAD